MNKNELVALVAVSTGMSRYEVSRALDSTINIIKDELVDKPNKTTRALDSEIQLIRDQLVGPGSNKKARTLDSTIDLIQEHLVEAGKKVSIAGFGTFYTVARKARVGRNPRTGAEIRIKARIVPKFKPSQTLVDQINK